MKTSNISYLRNHLSEIISHVRKGETVLVLDRDKPVARLCPYTGEGNDTPTPLLELRRQGILTREKSGPSPTSKPPLALPKAIDLTAYILEDRGEP